MQSMSFFTLPRELRDQVYRELLITDEPLDLMLLIKSDGACKEAKTRKPRSIDVSILETCRQVRDEGFAMLSQSNAFCVYDDSSKSLTELFGEPFSFRMLRDKIDIHRERVEQQTNFYLHRVRHLHININSSTPDAQSSHRLSLRAATALAHEFDCKGYSSFQANLWQHSLTAYMIAAILPSARDLRMITIDVSGFLHSESKQLLLDGIPRLYALGHISLRILLNGKSDSEVMYGRNAIDRRVLEQYLSKACGEKIEIPKNDFLMPRNLLATARVAAY
ncbi:hypothetical protein NA57DRAFT_59362 [Rhizodiscina lignyota]|uniref:F-box domain-containing protein n=1 Tax=Rhizodiscina lignyota TaxID=1504668 RepID=A0A9P4I8C5_9PEZI|nr:hypothetical protein NA57DRAFT_59362 [Rhizodiscina lignyota]